MREREGGGGGGGGEERSQQLVPYFEIKVSSVVHTAQHTLYQKCKSKLGSCMDH